MINTEKMSDHLGVNTSDLAEKCSKFTMNAVEKLVMTGDVTNQQITDSMELFNDADKTYMSICYLMEKANKIMQDPLAIQMLKGSLGDIRARAQSKEGESN